MTAQPHEDTPRTVANLLALIAASRGTLAAVVEPLSEAELSAPGPEGWAVKDHLAHLAVWQRSLIALLEGKNRHAAMGLPGEKEAISGDELNARLYQLHRDRPGAEVLAFSHDTHARLLAVLGRLSDQDLMMPYSHFQPDDPPYNAQPVLGWIAGNTFGHEAEHLTWIEQVLAAP